jgi:hypothetical protein
MGIFGTSETKKAIQAAGNGFIGLKDIDWSCVGKELGELDAEESKALFIEATEVLLKIVGFAQQYRGIIKLIITFLK